MWDAFSSKIVPVTNQLTTTVRSGSRVTYRHFPSAIKLAHFVYLLKSCECIHKNPNFKFGVFLLYLLDYTHKWMLRKLPQLNIWGGAGCF